MTALSDEIDSNFALFRSSYSTAIGENLATLEARTEYAASYRRIASIQALKSYVVVPGTAEDAAAFFVEAQNDLLLSHVQASIGSWRVALQSLRSAIESVCACLYYMDHPIELELWRQGAFRLGFSAASKYFESHPKLSGLPGSIVFDILREEYATLSKAVHGSAVDFWMTHSDGEISLWNTEASRAGMWGTREKKVVQGLCLLTMCLFSHELTGTKNAGVRDTLGLLLSSGQKNILSAELSINVE